MTAVGDEVKDRARGCLLGLAVGDALGGPVEWLSSEAIEQRHGGPLRRRAARRQTAPELLEELI